MTEERSQSDLHVLSESYSRLSRDDLLIELQRLVKPSDYGEPPSDAERRREGEALWARIREKVADLVCKDRKEGGAKSLNALIVAGGTAFIQEFAKMLLGAGIMPGVTAAIAAAVGALLYVELQKGVDEFCEAYYTAEDEA